MKDSYARRVLPDGELHPNAGERALEEKSGLWDLIEPFALSAPVTLAGGTTTPTLVVASQFGKGKEGILVAFALENDTQSFGASPWWVKTASRDDRGNVNDDGRILAGPFTTQVGSLAQPFAMPHFPLPIGRDQQVAIYATNADPNQAQARGFIVGFVWRFDTNQGVRRAVWGAAVRGELWRPGLFGGEG